MADYLIYRGGHWAEDPVKFEAERQKILNANMPSEESRQKRLRVCANKAVLCNKRGDICNIKEDNRYSDYASGGENGAFYVIRVPGQPVDRSLKKGEYKTVLGDYIDGEYELIEEMIQASAWKLDLDLLKQQQKRTLERDYVLTITEVEFNDILVDKHGTVVLPD